MVGSRWISGWEGSERGCLAGALVATAAAALDAGGLRVVAGDPALHRHPGPAQGAQGEDGEEVVEHGVNLRR